MTSSRAPGQDTPDKLSALGKLLETAVRLVAEVAADPLLPRLTQAFSRMPREDRATILGVIEREVEHRAVTVKTAPLTGYALVPNPNARLYVRVFRTLAPVKWSDGHDIMLATLQSLRAMPLVLASNLHAVWLAAAREAAGHLEPHERAAARRVLTEMLALLASAEEPVAEQSM